MVNYRRNFVPGGSYFFTVTLHNRNSGLLIESIDTLRLAFRNALHKKPCTVDAVVILPEHLHTIWTLPSGDSDYPGRWQAIKSIFSLELKKSRLAIDKNNAGDSQIWQRHYWEHTIRDDNDFNRHIDYIHYNPVKHGLVKSATDWPYSSLHRYIRQGVLPPNWGGQIDEMNCGE